MWVKILLLISYPESLLKIIQNILCEISVRMLANGTGCV
jgi:hypothetical protein